MEHTKTIPPYAILKSIKNFLGREYDGKTFLMWPADSILIHCYIVDVVLATKNDKQYNEFFNDSIIEKFILDIEDTQEYHQLISDWAKSHNGHSPSREDLIVTVRQNCKKNSAEYMQKLRDILTTVPIKEISAETSESISVLKKLLNEAHKQKLIQEGGNNL